MNLELKIDHFLRKINNYIEKAAEYLYEEKSDLTSQEIIVLLQEVPTIISRLDQLLDVYVCTLEEEYLKTRMENNKWIITQNY